MKEFKGVIGSMETVPEVEVNKTTTYVRSNIERIEEVDEVTGATTYFWKYDEIQYENYEYIDIMAKEAEIMKKLIDYFATIVNVE